MEERTGRIVPNKYTFPPTLLNCGRWRRDRKKHTCQNHHWCYEKNLPMQWGGNGGSTNWLCIIQWGVTTVYRLFGILPNSFGKGIGTDKERRLKVTFRNIFLLVIDERSMISADLLRRVKTTAKVVVHNGLNKKRCLEKYHSYYWYLMTTNCHLLRLELQETFQMTS